MPGRIVVTKQSALSAVGDGSNHLAFALKSGLTGVVPGAIQQSSQHSYAGVFLQGVDGDLASRYKVTLQKVLNEVIPEGDPAEFDGVVLCRGYSVVAPEQSADGKDLPPFTEARLHDLLLSELRSHGAQVPPSQIVMIDAACASGLYGLAMARERIITKRWRRALVIAIDLTTIANLWRLFALGVLARSTDLSLACRPFSISRSGTVRSEGAAAVVLEDEAFAPAGSAIMVVSGVGICHDPMGVATGGVNIDSTVASMHKALRDAKLQNSEIDLVKAHGTGTVANDRAESLAIRQFFGSENKLPVVSLKGQFGHTGNASGIFELVACSYFFSNQCIYPTFNCEDLDPQCPVQVVRERRPAHLRRILCNASGLGGFNCSILLEQP